ncbi:unnamed protein product [Discosporangium mesarthrocarpum]
MKRNQQFRCAVVTFSKSYLRSACLTHPCTYGLKQSSVEVQCRNNPAYRLMIFFALMISATCAVSGWILQPMLHKAALCSAIGGNRNGSINTCACWKILRLDTFWILFEYGWAIVVIAEELHD